MMPRSKTSSAWCVSCVGVLSGTGARGRECKRADPHPLNLELDPRSWPPIYGYALALIIPKCYVLRGTLPLDTGWPHAGVNQNLRNCFVSSQIDLRRGQRPGLQSSTCRTLLSI